MDWKIRHTATHDVAKPIFSTRNLAEAHIIDMGSAFGMLYEPIPVTDNEWQFKVLVEGLVGGDLRRIILPQISIDEYVPGDPNTDNVVIAFFIKGVPEAVIPFRDFITKCRGVLDVAYGDSDTIPNASIVYAEMSRENFNFDDLGDMMDQVAMLSDLDVEDFSLVFPSSSRLHPYSAKAIQGYFNARSSKKNWKAQQQAIDDAGQDQETTGASEDESELISQDEKNEAMVEHLVEMAAF